MKKLKRIVCLALTLMILISVVALTSAQAANVWRDKYRDIMRDFTAQNVQGSFLLHDIDGSGTPELIVLSRDDFEIFVFSAGETNPVRLEVDSGAFAPFFAAGDGGVFRTSADNTQGIIFASYWSAASTYTRWVIDGNKLVAAVSGGVTASVTGGGEEVQEWRLDGRVSTQAEIEREFYSGEIISVYEITLANSTSAILGWRLPTRPEPRSVTATPTQAAVMVNGERVAFQAYHIDGHNFFRIRDIAYALNSTPARFNVTWDYVNSIIRIVRYMNYTVIGGEMVNTSTGPVTATSTQSPIQIGGNTVNMRAYHIDGRNYFMLRELGEQLGFDVDWDYATRSVLITT